MHTLLTLARGAKKLTNALRELLEIQAKAVFKGFSKGIKRQNVSKISVIWVPRFTSECFQIKACP